MLFPRDKYKDRKGNVENKSMGKILIKRKVEVDIFI